jgi:Spy/CpxP family protein refolding chaperone
LKAFKRAERKAVRPLFDKERDLMDTLKDQMEDKASDAELAKTLTAVETNRQALKEQFEKFRAQKDAILTPTQRAKMLVERSERRGVGAWANGDGRGWGGRSFGEGKDDRECPSHKPFGHDDEDRR